MEEIQLSSLGLYVNMQKLLGTYSRFHIIKGRMCPTKRLHFPAILTGKESASGL